MDLRGNEGMDRRRFLQRAALVGAAVPAIMTMTAPGALAATCSATTGRDDGCVCTKHNECTQPARCAPKKHTTLECCIQENQLVRSGVCTTGNDPSCCSDTCSTQTNRCLPA